MKNKAYVYFHYTEDTGELFYIGKGTNNRYKDTYNRGQYWKKIVNKHGFTPIIKLANLPDDVAFLQEYLAIKEFSPRANITEGGCGFTSQSALDIWKQPEHRIKMKKLSTERWQNKEFRSKMIKNMRDRYQDKEYKRDIYSKISKKLKNKPLNGDRKQKSIQSLKVARKHITASTYDKISKKLKGRPKNMTKIHKENISKAVKQRFKDTLKYFNVYSAKSGELVGTWQFQNKCASDLKLSTTGICNCLGKRQATSGGYIFKYID